MPFKDANGRAYNRTKYIKQRHDMMQHWSDYLTVYEWGRCNMTKPIIKKSSKGFISYSPNMPENIQIEILSILGVDKSNTDTNALFNKINYQTAF